MASSESRRTFPKRRQPDRKRCDCEGRCEECESCGGLPGRLYCTVGSGSKQEQDNADDKSWRAENLRRMAIQGRCCCVHGR